MEKKLTFFDKISSLLLTFLIFAFFIDSGGPIGIRTFSLFIILFIYLKSFTKVFSSRQSHVTLISYIFILLLVIFSITWSCINGIDFLATTPWVVPILMLPIFVCFFSQFNPEIVKLSFISAGVLFSISVFTVFICIFTLGDVVKQFFYDLKFPGWFYLRGDGYPQVYFQSTLAFVVMSVYAYLNGYKRCSVLLLFSLIISLSRFGSLVVILCIFLNFCWGTKKFAFYSFYFLIFLAFSFIPIAMLVYFFLPSDVNYQVNADIVRLGHLMSIFDSMEPIQYVFGMGPGSVFYSVGFEAWVDNIEVSQLELFRKYGVVGYIFFHISFLSLSWYLLKVKKYSSQVSMSAFYIVAYSNPVLMTFLFPIFVGVFLSDNNASVRITNEKKQL